MNETATTIDAAAPALPRLRHARRSSTAGCSSRASRRSRRRVAVFLLVQLSAWPPHEDETLPLFVGRQPIDDLFDIVLGKRGGGPVALPARLDRRAHREAASRPCASSPHCSRWRASRRSRYSATGSPVAGLHSPRAVLAAASWVLLFHGIYARMYSLFLFLSTLVVPRPAPRDSNEAGNGPGRSGPSSMLLTIGSHPYGALVLGSQGLYVLVTRQQAPPGRSRPSRPCSSSPSRSGAAASCSPIVWTSASGGGGGKLRTPREVFAYLWHVAGDSSTGYTGVLVDRARVRGDTASSGRRGDGRAARSSPPASCSRRRLFFLVGRFGGNSAPESRHLIFVLPFFALAAASRDRGGHRVRPAASAPVLAGFVVARARPPRRSPGAGTRRRLCSTARTRSASTPAARPPSGSARPHAPTTCSSPTSRSTSRPGSSDRSAVSRTVVPRADPEARARDTRRDRRSRSGAASGSFDAGDNNNSVKRTRSSGACRSRAASSKPAPSGRS